MRKAMIMVLMAGLILGIFACSKAKENPNGPSTKQEVKFLVRGDDGNPLPNATVQITKDGKVIATATSNAKGEVVASVDANLTNLQAQMDSAGYITSVGQSNLVRGAVEQKFNPLGSSKMGLVQFVVVSGQSALSGAEIKIFKGNALLKTLQTDSKGGASSDLELGSYTIQTGKAGYQNTEVYFTLRTIKQLGTLVLNLTLAAK